MLRPQLVTPSPLSVLTREQLKSHLRVTHTDEDALLDGILNAVSESLDGYSGDLGIALLPQTWKIEYQAWPLCIRLPLAPVTAITSIKYYDPNNDQQTWDAANYALHTNTRGPYVRYARNVQPPTLYLDRDDCVEVVFVAGYADVTSVPATIKQAMLIMAADLYKNRESLVTGTIVAQIPQYVQRLLARHNRVGLS